MKLLDELSRERSLSGMLKEQVEMRDADINKLHEKLSIQAEHLGKSIEKLRSAEQQLEDEQEFREILIQEKQLTEKRLVEMSELMEERLIGEQESQTESNMSQKLD